MSRFLLSLLAGLFITSTAYAQSYRLQPGDTLRVEVLEDETLNRSVLVLPDGSINFSSAGGIRVRGRTADSVAETLEDLLASDFAERPNIFVSVESLAPIREPREPRDPKTSEVFVMGEVTTPGEIKVKPGITVLQALAAAGGVTRFAATKRIELRRNNKKTGQEEIYLFNYKDPRAEGSIKGNTRLNGGDVLVVPARKLFE